MSSFRYYLLLFFYGWSGLTNAQEFSLGIGIEAGSSWEIERLPYNAPPTLLTGIEGGTGFAVALEAGYRMNTLVFSFRPALLVQQTTVFRLPGDDSGQQFRQQLYPSAILLPLRASLAFGQQRFQPVLGLGGGFLVAIEGKMPATATPRPEPVLPYLEVSVGVEFHLGTVRLRPELTVRNGTGELFSAGRSGANRAFGGQRWAYAGFGVIVSN